MIPGELEAPLGDHPEARAGRLYVLDDVGREHHDGVLADFGGSVSRQIGLASMDTGEWSVLIEEGYVARYSPSGHVLYARFDGSFWAAAFDVDRLEITEEPVAANEAWYSMPTARPGP